MAEANLVRKGDLELAHLANDTRCINVASRLGKLRAAAIT